ncbi:MAG: hypothetical protein K2L10_05445 [Ruminococcus sp.]|nr:hypothetical protein [Ruminococcus sp.]
MKKLLKKIFLFLMVFLVTLYFIGSCTERPDYKPKEESNTPVFTELTPDEYQRQMDEIIKKQPVTQTVFKSHMIQAYADNAIIDKLDEWFDKTNLYKIDDFVSGYFDYLRNPDSYFDDIPNVPPPKGKSKEAAPVTSYTVPVSYNFYAKNRITYNNGVSEIVVCRMNFDYGSTSATRYGHVTFTRSSSAGYATSFGFDIKSVGLALSFSSSQAFSVNYMPVKSNVSGIDINSNSSFFNYSCSAYFVSGTTNSIYTKNAGNSTVRFNDIAFSGSNSDWYNRFTICQTFSNDYTFIQCIDSYQGGNRVKSVNKYYDNHMGETITTNNYNNYKDYGVTYNKVTNSLEFDPDILAGYFNGTIKPSLEAGFDSVFSVVPDIGAEINGYTGELNNLVEIINQSTATATTGGTYPVATGDINVNVTVDVTFPEEFYKKYPALTTEPAFVAENPDVDFAFDSPLPVRGLQVAGRFITLASDFIYDAGLMPVALMCVSLGLVTMFFL